MPNFKVDLDLIQQEIDRWNARNKVGASVAVKGYEGRQTTRTEAMILFDQKPVIYLEGYNGYFDLADVTPDRDAPGEAPKAVRQDLAFMFPGQGSQHLGMGADLFDANADLVARADRVLGYSIKRLCLEDPNEVLSQTQYTQPALYTVSALAYLERKQKDPEVKPAFFLGHSLGEYTALFAAGVFDFETGLKLVRERGILMAEARGGGMAAVIGMDAEAVTSVLEQEGLDRIDVANINTPVQTVISGMAEDVANAEAAFQAAGARVFIPLQVSGAFHSRYMKEAQTGFARLLESTDFAPPETPVIANVTAKPYEPEAIGPILAEQLVSPVRWRDSIAYALSCGVETFEEIGPGEALTGMTPAIRKAL